MWVPFGPGGAFEASNGGVYKQNVSINGVSGHNAPSQLRPSNPTYNTTSNVFMIHNAIANATNNATIRAVRLIAHKYRSSPDSAVSFALDIAANVR